MPINNPFYKYIETIESQIYFLSVVSIQGHKFQIEISNLSCWWRNSEYEHPKNSVLEKEEWYRRVSDALTEQNSSKSKEYKFSLKNSQLLIIFNLKLQENEEELEFKIKIELEQSKDQSQVERFFKGIVDTSNRIKTESEMVQTSQLILQKELNWTQEQLQSHLKDQRSREDLLYTKFALLLNEKKNKIIEQHDLIVEYERRLGIEHERQTKKLTLEQLPKDPDNKDEDLIGPSKTTATPNDPEYPSKAIKEDTDMTNYQQYNTDEDIYQAETEQEESE